MIPIGTFARLTGLSARALRLYHDRGVLVPGHVDERTGYRTYTADQIEDAVRVAVLRRADLPLDRIAALTAEPDRAGDVLAEHRAGLAGERARVDRALEHAERAIAGESAVVARRTPAGTTAWTAVVSPELSSGTPDPALDARVDEAAARCRTALTERGIPPVAPFWTTLRLDGPPAVVVHWPLPGGVDTPELPDGMTRAEWPERDELVVRVPVPDEPGDESVQLALAALLRGADGRAGDPATLRQTGLGDVVEFAVLTAAAR